MLETALQGNRVQERSACTRRPPIAPNLQTIDYLEITNREFKAIRWTRDESLKALECVHVVELTGPISQTTPAKACVERRYTSGAGQTICTRAGAAMMDNAKSVGKQIMHREGSPSAVSDARSIAVIVAAEETASVLDVGRRTPRKSLLLLTWGCRQHWEDLHASTTKTPAQWLERAVGSTPDRRTSTRTVHFRAAMRVWIPIITIHVEVKRATRKSFCSLRIDADALQ